MPVRPAFTRADVVAHARQWLGTPYHHQVSRCGVGCDCIGLVRGVWRELLGEEPEALPGYARDWAEASGRETLLEAAARHLVPATPGALRAGDVLIFRYRTHTLAKHAGILAEACGTPTFIHAVEGAPVAEVPLTGWWRRRLVAAFSFPGSID